MKKKFLILTLICFLFSFTCGCAHKIPQYLPGENEGDFHFVWVCKKPFGFFFLPDDNEGYYGLLKGYIEKEGKLAYFYSAFNPNDGRTYFLEGENIDDLFYHESFTGHGYYYKNDFGVHIKDDSINFFAGEVPELRFEKMTKETFLERYGEIENVSELLG